MIRITASEGKQYITSFAQLQSGQSISLDTTILSKEDVGNIYIAIITKRITVSSEDETKIRDKILSEGGGTDLENLTPEELQNLAVKLISTGAFATEDGENTIESVSVNGYVLTPDINKNVNINISASGGGGINVVDYYPEDNVIITGPTLIPSSQGVIWDGEYLSSDNNEENVLTFSGSENSINLKYVSVKLPLPSSGSISIDASETIKYLEIQTSINGEISTDVISQQMIMLCSKPDENVGSFYTKFYNSSENSESFPFSTFNIVKNSDNTFAGNTLYSSSSVGNASDNFTVPVDCKLVFHFMNYIEYAIQLEGITLEQVYQMLTPEEIAVYSAIRVIVISKPDTSLMNALGYLAVDPELTDLHFAIGSVNLEPEDNLFPESKLKVDASIREYILPEDITDGTYLNIKENTILLGQQLKANDFFLLYGNLTKGIPIHISSTDSPSPTGTFRGYLNTEPSDPEDGDWYIKSVYVSQNNSYSNLMYVWVSNIRAWKLVGFVPNSSGGGLTGLTYNSSSNRITNSNGYNLAGYLGSFSYQPTPNSYYESSIYYNTSTQKFYYYSYGTWYECPTGQNLIFTNTIDSSTTNHIPYAGAVINYVYNQRAGVITNSTTLYDEKLPTIQAVKNYIKYDQPIIDIKENFYSLPTGIDLFHKRYQWNFNHNTQLQTKEYMAKDFLKYKINNVLTDIPSNNFAIVKFSNGDIRSPELTDNFEIFNSLAVYIEVPQSDEIRSMSLYTIGVNISLKFNKGSILETNAGSINGGGNSTNRYIISLEREKVNTTYKIRFKICQIFSGTSVNLEDRYTTLMDFPYGIPQNAFFSINTGVNEGTEGANPTAPIKILKVSLTSLEGL